MDFFVTILDILDQGCEVNDRPIGMAAWRVDRDKLAQFGNFGYSPTNSPRYLWPKVVSTQLRSGRARRSSRVGGTCSIDASDAGGTGSRGGPGATSDARDEGGSASGRSTSRGGAKNGRAELARCHSVTATGSCSPHKDRMLECFSVW